MQVKSAAEPLACGCSQAVQSFVPLATMNASGQSKKLHDKVGNDRDVAELDVAVTYTAAIRGVLLWQTLKSECCDVQPVPQRSLLMLLLLQAM